MAFFISVSFHEFAHGYVAYKMGDPTAKLSGRLTLNPVKHFDLYAILFFALFRFGWAKGVPIDSRNFKNEKHGMVYSALAGPVTNILIMFISLLGFYALRAWLIELLFGGTTSEALIVAIEYTLIFFESMIEVNAVLAIFNLLPLPPLDGSKIFLAFLPDRLYFEVLSYDRYMMIASLILVYTGVLDKFIFTGASKLIMIFSKIAGVIL